jgi:hypothetical protein
MKPDILLIHSRHSRRRSVRATLNRLRQAARSFGSDLLVGPETRAGYR